MAKDPAFLFYPNDWIGGTLGMTFEEKGAYMELLILQFNKGPFTIEQAKRTLNVSFTSVWETMLLHFKCENGVYHNKRLAEEKEKREKFTESRRNSRLKSDEDNVKIYLIKDFDTGYYKIGSSVNPLRRFAEMRNQKKPAIVVGSRNYELFWVSKVVERITEKKLHEKFEKRWITGEWFNLSEADIEYIKNTYGDQTYDQTYDQTETQRMENENININGNGKEDVFNWENEKSKFIQGGDWIFKFCRDKNLTVDEFDALAKDFLADCDLKEDFKPIKELRSHFVNIFNKRKNATNSEHPASSNGKQKLGTSAARIKTAKDW